MSEQHKTVIVWFRRDFRLQDNPALLNAVTQGDGRILPVFILDDDISPPEQIFGAASRVWMHHALKALNASLDGHLACFSGNAEDIIAELCSQLRVTAVYANHYYTDWQQQQDNAVTDMLSQQDIPFHRYNGMLLWDPGSALKDDGTPYRVFTPFYKRGCLARGVPREPLDAPSSIDYRLPPEFDVSIDDLNLLPEKDWHNDLAQHWNISESGAHERMEAFFEEGLGHYKEGRDIPGKPYTSRLSPYLHYGQISPHTAWYASQHYGKANKIEKHVDKFHSELGWREFSYSLLRNNPNITTDNIQQKFDNFPWQHNDDYIHAWKFGKTGYPLVDAGMRQLRQTGYVHNRIRMVVASFLIKNLMTDWRIGEAWFRDCLVDYDVANNSASWQWVAGSGADAAPYFRIFNPLTQSQKFDKEGDYIRHFVPELHDMPGKHIHVPWEAPNDILKGAGVVLGETYPKPVVDIKASRERALAAFDEISN